VVEVHGVVGVVPLAPLPLEAALVNIFYGCTNDTVSCERTRIVR
jgi:hypothetical protein